jgi:hypothetical protein
MTSHNDIELHIPKFNTLWLKCLKRIVNTIMKKS